MLSKKANQFIIELKMYLMSKGKNDYEINIVIDELTDHLIQAEAAGKDIKEIIGNSPRAYMQSIGQEMGVDLKGLLVLIPMTALLLIAYTCLAPALLGEFSLSKMGVYGAIAGCILSLILFGFIFVKVLPKMFYSKWLYVILGFAYLLLTGFFILVNFFDEEPFFVATPLQNNLILIGCFLIFLTWAFYVKTWTVFIIPLLISIGPITQNFVPEGKNEDPLYITIAAIFSILCLVVLFYFMFRKDKEDAAS